MSRAGSLRVEMAQTTSSSFVGSMSSSTTTTYLFMSAPGWQAPARAAAWLAWPGYCCSMLTAVKQRLAAAKMGSALLIDLCVFALCFGSFLAVMYFAFGFDDITSGELLQVAFNPQGLDAMGVLGWIVLSSLLAFLAVNAFTLFVSSRLRSSLGVVAISAAVALIPTIIRMFMAGGSFGHGFAAAEGNLLNWLRLCLPSGGVSLTGAMMDELTGLRFLWIGDFVTWSPYVMLTATAVQIPLSLIHISEPTRH